MIKISIFEVFSDHGLGSYEIRRENGVLLGSYSHLSDALSYCWTLVSTYGLCLVDNYEMSLPVVHELYFDRDGNKSLSKSKV